VIELRRALMLLGLLVKNFLRRLAGRGAPERPTHGEFSRVIAELAARAPAEAIAAIETFDIPATRPPWLDTGIDLGPEDQVSLFAVGGVTLSRMLDIRFAAKNQLWYRVGEEGEIAKATGASHTFHADKPGRLYICGLFVGAWADKQGRLATPRESYAKGDGGISVGVVKWRGDAEAVLGAIAGGAAASGDRLGESARLAARELTHIRERVETPAGWFHFWELGASEIYARRPGDHGSVMCCHTSDNAGILQRDVDCALTPSTRVKWRWKVDTLPSRYAEDTLPTHDYLSIAFEFENGRDLSYYWSSKLPAGRSYHCPMPGWENRETHFVVRSGSSELGRWFSEERNLYDDYAAAIGEPPSRIVRVWFIAVSAFQRGEGQCEYAAVSIEDGGRRIAVLDS